VTATTATEGPGRVAVLDRDAVLAAFDTSAAGLSEAEARARLARVGPNAIQEVPGPSWARRLLGQFTHLFALLLWAGSALAFAAGQAGIGIAIIAVIVLNGIFGFLQEHRAERAVAALRRLLPASPPSSATANSAACPPTSWSPATCCSWRRATGSRPTPGCSRRPMSAATSPA
jgi:magnesium-transporting ATPase (P-type)